MEAELDKDHNKLESKDMASSHDLSHVSIDSPQNTWIQDYRICKHDGVSE